LKNSRKIIQLYPQLQHDLDLEGLYLQADSDEQKPLVYTNFITSMDGRIAIEHPVTGKRGVPEFITNPRDWRLYQELAARADVLLVSARYLRELAKGEAQAGLPVSDEPAFQDLKAWRRQQSMTAQPAVVILSASLNLPLSQVCEELDRDVYVATGEQADTDTIEKIESSGAKVLYAGKGKQVEGQKLIEQLNSKGYQQIYSIAGPGVLETLLRAGVLGRIYLTQVHRMIGGASYDTLFEGQMLMPPADFKLRVLYFDQRSGEECGQCFGIYDITNKKISNRIF
jgi:riboflavin biosynthesis pyrimidine reductase